MNKKFWKYSIFASVVIVVVVLLLILVPIIENKTNKKSNNESYANYFSLNTPSLINVYVGSKIKLKDGYISIKPTIVLTKMTVDIKTAGGDSTNGLIFKDNEIISKQTGNYIVKFKVPKSSSEYFIKTIDINVFDSKENAHIHLLRSITNVGISISLENLFSFKSNNYLIVTDDKLTHSNGIITANKEGESNIIFVFNEGFVDYVYNFSIFIEPKATYEIILSNVENNRIETEFEDELYLKIQYEITNGVEENVVQDVLVVSSDENIVSVEEIEEPFITLFVQSKGEVVITITHLLDPGVKKTLTINII